MLRNVMLPENASATDTPSHQGLLHPPWETGSEQPRIGRRHKARDARNLATKVPKSAQPWVATLVRTIYEQPDAASVRAQHAQVVTALEAKFPQAAAHLDEAREDILAFTAFPREIWRQIWSNNPGTAEQGNTPPHRRRWDLPQP
jgi:Transposase, Mutator family